MTDWGEFLQDLAYEQYMEERYLEQIAEEGVDKFSRDRLQAYYRENPDVARKALDALRVAESLVVLSPSASLVFAAVSLELTVKDVLLHPLVVGLVHNEAIASFVAQYAIGRGGAARFESLLRQLLDELADVDPTAYCRVGEATPIAREISRVVRLRNEVLHDGRVVAAEDADEALKVARAMLFDVFPTVVRALDMATDDELRVLWE